MLVCCVSAAHAQFVQQGNKFAGTGLVGASRQGWAVALSSDGKTAIVGGTGDNGNRGATWVFTRSGGAWVQQGTKLVPSDINSAAGPGSYFGSAIATSSDGSTVVIGGLRDNNLQGAAWVFTRNGGVWAQQGTKLVGAGASGNFVDQGWAVAISSDGNVAAVGGPFDNNGLGAVWIFTRTGAAWTQDAMLIPDALGSFFGESVALSGDGNTLLAGGFGETTYGAVWVFNRNNGKWMEEAKFSPPDGVASAPYFGGSAAVSADGRTAIIGGYADNNEIGAAWIYARTDSGWTEQAKLVGTGTTGPSPRQGWAVALSADGNTAIVGGPGDNTDARGRAIGAAWLFHRANGVWTQLGGKLVGSGFVVGPQGSEGPREASSVALSGDGGLALIGGSGDDNGSGTETGAAWVFATTNGTPSPVSVSPGGGNWSMQQHVFTFSDSAGYQDLGVLNILVNNFLDGRHACYLAYSRPSNTLLLVNDAGNAGGPFAGTGVLDNAGSIGNSQCTVTWSRSAVSQSGTNLSLSLNIAFSAAFAGNKVIYMAARNVMETNSGWVPLGVAQVASDTQTTSTSVVGMSPFRGSGQGPATFTFTFSDTLGYFDLGVMNILINNFIDGRHACYLAYALGQPGGTLYLVDDAGDAGGSFAGSASILTPGSLKNSQCTVSWGANAQKPSGNDVSLTLNIAFTPTFNGNRVFYLAARDLNGGNNTDWQAMGTWTVQ
jgi:hypothetical protein